MHKTKCYSNLLTRLLLSITLILGLTNVSGIAKAYGEDGANGSSVTYVAPNEDAMTYHGWTQKTRYMEIDGTFALCCTHFRPTPSQGAAAWVLDGNVTNDLMRKVAWYGHGGPGDIGLRLVSTACAMSVANGTDQTDLGKDTLNQVRDLPSPPSSFTVTKWSTGGTTQDMATWTYTPDGYIDLQKVSANPDITDNNPCYSLVGAVYGIYADGGCTNLVTTITTDANGYAASGKVAVGSYWVREISAPSGYALDQNTYPITVNPDATTRVNNSTVVDQPQNDPADALVFKYDGQTPYSANNLPQGSASLALAQYEFKYYEGYHSTVDELSGLTPKRTWEMQTDERGWVDLRRGDATFTTKDGQSHPYKVSGDEFFYSSLETITLPLGTLTVKETKAPEGYLLPTDNHVYVQQITPNGITGEDVNSYDAPQTPEQVIRGGLSLTKIGCHVPVSSDVKDPLAGVDFQIINSNDNAVIRPDGTTAEPGEAVVTITTDDHGYADTGDDALAYGTYTVHEVPETVPDGYRLVDDFKVSITDNGQKFYYVLEDGTGTYIRVLKLDVDSGKKVAGYMTFRVLDKDMNVVTFTRYYPDVEHITALTTNADGSCVLPEPLNGGDQYYIQEIKAPEGYVLNDTPVPFVADGTGGWTIDHPLEIKVSDKVEKGIINISKIDADTNKTVKVPGIEYDVIANSDIVTHDGVVHAYADDVVAHIISSGDGVAKTPELYLGSYRVVETKAPEGYVLNPAPQNVELTYAGQSVDVTYKDASVTDKPVTINISKTRAGTDQPLGGITFGYWIKNDETVLPQAAEGKALVGVKAESDLAKISALWLAPKADDGTLDEANATQLIYNKLLGIWMSTEVAYGDYELEVSYTCDEENSTTGVQWTDTLTSVCVNEAHQQALFEASATATVVDRDHTVKWQTTQVPAFIDKAKVHEATTNAEGKLNIKYLSAGTYGFAELKTLPGYVLDATPQYLTVDTNGLIDGKDSATLNFTNNFTHIAIDKINKNTGESLAGATLTLYHAPDPDKGDEAYGDKVDSWTSTGEPHELDTLAAGEYILHEDAAPYHYLVSDDVSFNVDDTTPALIEIKMSDDYTKHDILKTDSDTGKALPGATLGIKDATGGWIDPSEFIKASKDGHMPSIVIVQKDGAPVKGWISTESSVRFEGLAPGDYTLVELVVPQGWQQADPVAFTVGADGDCTTISMQDDRLPSMPKTGDSFVILGILVVIVIVAGAVVISTYRNSKKEKQEKTEAEKK